MKNFIISFKNLIKNIMGKEKTNSSEKLNRTDTHEKENSSINDNIVDNNHLDELSKELSNLYNDFFLRINPNNWRELLNNKTKNNLDMERLSNKLLTFIMKNSNLPYGVWVVLDEYFNWNEKYNKLCELYPKSFANFVLANINNEYRLRYDLINEDINGLYDEFINSYYEAYFALKHKDLYLAKKSIDKAKEIFKDHFDLIILESNYYEEFNNVEKAIEKLEYVLSIDDKYADAYLNRAGIHMKIGELEKAYEDYHKCLSIEPNNISAKYNLARCTFNIGRYKESENLYSELEIDYPYNNEIKANLNSVNNFLIDILEEKLSTGIYTHIDKFDLAKSYFYFKDYDRCYELIENVENCIEPTDTLYFILGDTLKALGNKEKAMVYYNEGISLNADNWKTHYSKGLLLQELKAYEEAVKCFDTVIKLKSNYPKVYESKGLALKNLNKYKEAIHLFDKCINMDNNNYNAYQYKGEVLIKLDEYENAIEYFDKAMDLSKGNPSSYYMKGVAIHLMNYYKDAINYYQWCYEYKDYGYDDVEFKHLYAKSLYNAAMAMINLGGAEDAYDFFDKAIREDESFIPAYGGKILISIEQGNYNECIDICSVALNIHDSNYPVKNIIKEFREKLHNYDLDIKVNYDEICQAVDNLYNYIKGRD